MKYYIFSPRQWVFYFLFSFPFIIHATVHTPIQGIETETPIGWLNKIGQIRSTSPDSALHLYQASFDYYINANDTLSAVNTLVEIALTYGHTAQYQSAYDNLWQALLLADLANNDEAKVQVYTQLGRYYSFYKRKEKSITYLKHALQLGKKLVNSGQLEKSDLSRNYYALCSTYGDLNDIPMAKIYLDSCFQIQKESSNLNNNNYLYFQKATIQSAEGNHQAALNTLSEIQPWFSQNNPGFKVLLYTSIGDVNKRLTNLNIAEKNYLKALDISNKYKSHLDFVPTIHERLSVLYKEKGDFKQAFTNLQKVQALDKQFFDSRSKNNASLLEIKDEFRETKEQQEKYLQEQRVAQLEQEERLANMQKTLWIVISIFLLFAGILYFKYFRNKHKTEKELIRKKRELEIQQANELLELKNRELAASSLKLIEKDEILATLKERLSQGKGDMKEGELKKIVRSISSSNAQNWDEFETRFISVNKEFFKKLNKQFPKLTRGDLKLCSLIKLNLTSKEMAKLLGISLESVHTNRYRLRKKLGLEKSISLTEFVASL